MKKQKFRPTPGQVDFTDARWAPVINCVVKYHDRILVVQRSKKLHFYPERWNGISGFLDDQRSLEQKIKDELKEELGIHTKDIKRIRLGEIFDQEAPKYKKTWIVHPVLIEVTTEKVMLNWEAKSYKWITQKEVKQLNFLPGFDRVLAKLMQWL